MSATAVDPCPQPVLDAPHRHRVLVGVDGSLPTELALVAAISMARRHHGTITLLAVAPDILGTARRCATLQPGAPYPAGLQEEADTDARRRLHEVARRIPREIPVTTTLRHGPPGRAIVAELSQTEYDAVMTGTLGAPLQAPPRRLRHRRSDRARPGRRPVPAGERPVVV